MLKTKGFYLFFVEVLINRQCFFYHFLLLYTMSLGLLFAGGTRILVLLTGNDEG
jgi:hypothetical protein